MAGSQPCSRACAMRLTAANAAGTIHAAETIIQGLSRCGSCTRAQYRARGFPATVKITKSGFAAARFKINAARVLNVVGPAMSVVGCQRFEAVAGGSKLLAQEVLCLLPNVGRGQVSDGAAAYSREPRRRSARENLWKAN